MERRGCLVMEDVFYWEADSGAGEISASNAECLR